VDIPFTSSLFFKREITEVEILSRAFQGHHPPFPCKSNTHQGGAEGSVALVARRGPPVLQNGKLIHEFKGHQPVLTAYKFSKTFPNPEWVRGVQYIDSSGQLARA
jgi:hypothetical protein